jgi:ribosomal protein S18 acetylase RimI-like enzyme
MPKIVKMQPQHRAAVQKILQEVTVFAAAEINIAMELIDIYLQVKKQKDYHFYVALDDTDTILGFLCYGPTPATLGAFDLYWIAVAKNIQQHGIGTLLLKFAESEVQRRNGRLLIIETSSRADYAATRHFYLRNKYIVTAQIKDFYATGEDRLIFIKYFNGVKTQG